MFSTGARATPKLATFQTSALQDCWMWKNAISVNPVKELHQQFPGLLTHIFGFGGMSGWNLCGCSKKVNAADFEAAREFLSPAGDLFKLIARLEEGGFLYEFPVTCIPQVSQQDLAEGRVPAFYEGKLKLNLSSSQGVPNHVYLSAFEFYLFHFAYYLIHLQIAKQLSLWAHLPESLYTVLLDSYLNYFLPCQGLVPSSITAGGGIVGRDQTTKLVTSSSLREYGTSGHSASPPSVLNTPMGLLSSTQAVLSSSRQYQASHSLSSGQSEVHSEIFVQTLVEFWLNHSRYESGRDSILAHSRLPESFSEERVRLIRMLVKHILYFTNGHVQPHSTSPSLSPFSSPMAAVTETLRSSVLQVYLQRRIYCFIKHVFRHWPPDDVFRYVLELWLTYVQPWRYTDPTKASTENKESMSELPHRWRVYVMENLPFYTTLVMEFLIRSFQLNLTSDIGATLLFRFSKVFAQPGLVDFISAGECLLLHPDSSPFPSSVKTSTRDLCSLRALFIDLDGTAFQYQPLFDSSTTVSIEFLFARIKQAKAQLVSLQPQLKSDTAESLFRPPTPLSSSLPSSPALPYQDKQQSWRSWLLGVMDGGLFDVSTKKSPNAGKPSTDLSKVFASLHAAENNIRAIFKLPGHSSFVQPPALQTDGSPMFLPRQSLDLGEVTNQAHLTIPPDTLIAEYEADSCKLTQRGKDQVLSGTRKCSNQKISSLRDPLLQPVRSYENAMLVRTLYQSSLYLNNKIAPLLLYIGKNKNIFCKLARQLLAPPAPSHDGNAVLSLAHVSETPVSRINAVNTIVSQDQDFLQSPRINFRLFASYYTMCYLVIFLILVQVLSLPWLFVVVLVLLFTLFYCVVRYIVSG